jgi:hypothetical protein
MISITKAPGLIPFCSQRDKSQTNSQRSYSSSAIENMSIYRTKRRIFLGHKLLQSFSFWERITIKSKQKEELIIG